MHSNKQALIQNKNLKIEASDLAGSSEPFDLQALNVMIIASNTSKVSLSIKIYYIIYDIQDNEMD